jgi:membrane-associated phospholipid phosphatase
LARPFVPIVRRLSGPGRFFAGRLTPGELGLELTTLVAIGAASTFAFVALGMRVGRVDLLPGDEVAFDVLRQINAGWVDELVRALTDLGGLPVTALVVAATAVWAVRHGRRLEALALVAGYLAIRAGVPLAKDGFGRARPTGPLGTAGGFAYPSGHAANATAFVACAVVLVRAGSGVALRIGAVGLAVTALVVVCLTRIYLRVHYLSDVLGGAALGFALFAAAGAVALVVAFLRHNAGSSE